MKKCFLLIFIYLFLFYSGQAQELSFQDSSISKTIELHEVVINGISIEKYAAGSRIQKIDKQQIDSESHSTLGRLLTRNSSIHFREYGNGMMSSVSMRGTGSSHTAVLWNGININSLTLGSLDFSLVPIAAVEKVEIHYGSASSLYGSDAIGGAIHLTSGYNWDKKGHSATFQQELGSFNTWFTSGGVTYGANNVYFKTNAYHKTSKNDFPFSYRSDRQRQNNAAYRFYGIVQEVGWKINPLQTLAFTGWFNHNFREIQPNMPANLFPRLEEIRDKNLRMTLDYKWDNRVGFFNLISGYVFDDQLYSLDNSKSKIAVHRLVNILQYEKDFSRTLTLKAGGEWTNITTDVDSYDKTIVEDRNDVFMSINIATTPWWKTTLNARKTIIAGHKTPFTPSIGNNIILFDSDRQQIIFKALASRGYRIPTLNDKYWPKSGDVNLLPEHSVSGEFGIIYGYKNDNHRFNFETSVYKMKVDDMIHWKPAGGDIWRPQNVRRVDVQGVEVHMDFEKRLSIPVTIHVLGNYALTHSINKKHIIEGDATKGKQLPYTPKHTTNLISGMKYGLWNISLINYYTGTRFTNMDETGELYPYLITNLDFSRSLRIDKMIYDVSIKINNLFNIEYQNYNSKAMPGINYQACIKIQFN